MSSTIRLSAESSSRGNRKTNEAASPRGVPKKAGITGIGAPILKHTLGRRLRARMVPKKESTLLIGSGASVTSGIRSGATPVAEWRKEFYDRLCQEPQVPHLEDAATEMTPSVRQQRSRWTSSMRFRSRSHEQCRIARRSPPTYRRQRRRSSELNATWTSCCSTCWRLRDADILEVRVRTMVAFRWFN